MMTSMNFIEEIGYTALMGTVPEEQITVFPWLTCHDDGKTMKKTLYNSNIAIVGGGRVCKAILEILLGVHFSNYHVQVLGVADIDEQAEGLLFARERGIPVTSTYQDLFAIRDLDLIIELTGDNSVLAELRASKPDQLRLIDHFEAMAIWDYLQIEEKSIEIREELGKTNTVEEIEKRFDHFAGEIAKIVEERTEHLQEVEKELVERERILAQIVEGNSIPTFVIDRNHMVTHWNREAVGSLLAGCASGNG
jgi:PAS domain-containing protein